MKPDAASERGKFRWRKPICAALAAILVLLPQLISSNADILYLFVIMPGLALIGVCLLIYAAIRKNLPVAVMVLTFCAVSVALFFLQLPSTHFHQMAFVVGSIQERGHG